MAKTISKGYTDTVTVTKNLALPDLSYGADFRVKSQDPGSAVLANITSPLDRTETLAFGYSEIKDVYKDQGIDPAVQAASHKGVQIMAKVNDVFSLTDSVDASYRVDLPVSAHVVIRVPACEYISASDIQALAARAVSGLFDTGSTGTTRLASVLKGALVPKEL